MCVCYSINNMFLPRYFYKNVWMPWDNDNDDEQDWADKHLKSRIQFNFDLMKSIDRPLAAHIRALLQEARDIEERRAFLETDLSEDEDLNETNRKCFIFFIFLCKLSIFHFVCQTNRK